MTALDDLITRANNTLSILEGLIEGDAGKIPLVDTSVSYTLPVIAYNADTQVWTLTQATVDPADGLYKGQFILALESGCAVLTINSQNVTTPGDGVPARVKTPPSEEDPTPSFVDVASIAALDGQPFNAFLIRSSTAFEVQVQVSACVPEWCYTFDFTSSNGDFHNRGGATPIDGSVYVSGEGWEAGCWNAVGDFNAIRIALNIEAPITSWEIEYDAEIGNGDLTNHSWVQVDADGLSYQEWTTINGTDQVKNWSGAAVAGNEIDITIWTSNGDCSGSATLRRLTLRGTGSNPFAENNC